MPFFEAIGILVSIILSNTFFNNSCSPHFICLCVSCYFNSSVKVSSFQFSPLFRRGFAFCNSSGHHILIDVSAFENANKDKGYTRHRRRKSDVFAAYSSATIDKKLVNVTPLGHRKLGHL